jgi:hypothetical protein
LQRNQASHLASMAFVCYRQLGGWFAVWVAAVAARICRSTSDMSARVLGEDCQFFIGKGSKHVPKRVTLGMRGIVAIFANTFIRDHFWPVSSPICPSRIWTLLT